MGGSIFDGQPVNAQITNSAKLDRQVDDTVLGSIDLLNDAPSSGPHIIGIQRVFNTLLTGVGGTQGIPATGYAPFPANTIDGSMSHEEAIATLARLFYGSASAGGHTHDGTDGMGAPISGGGIASVLHGHYDLAPSAVFAIGPSVDVSNIFGYLQASTASTIEGIVVNSPYNYCVLRKAASGVMGFPIIADTGAEVYGRLTNVAPTSWTLSFYKADIVADEVYSIPASAAASINFFYQNLYNPISDWPVYSDSTVLTQYSGSASGGGGGGGGGSGGLCATFSLSGAVVPYDCIDGTHYQAAAMTLPSVYMSLLDTGVSGETIVRVNQYRSGALFNSATASQVAQAGNPGGSNATLTPALSLAAGDIVSIDVLEAAAGASELKVEYINIGGGSTNSISTKFTLGGAVVPYVCIDGVHYQTSTATLSTINISLLNTGNSGSTDIMVNQYRSGALLNSATASQPAMSGNPGGSVATLTPALSLATGDIIGVDVIAVSSGASDLTVEY